MLKRLSIIFGLCCSAQFAQADEIANLILNETEGLPESVFVLAENGDAGQPIVQYRMCEVTPAECAPFQNPDAVITLTQAAWDTMNGVNLFGNSMVNPMSDKDAYGFDEFWATLDIAKMNMKGDCEDIARLKISELIKEGFPDSALRLATGYTPAGEGHAVVVVKTNRGDFVLDNLTDEILPIEESALSFRSVQSSVHSGQWKIATLQFRN